MIADDRHAANGRTYRTDDRVHQGTAYISRLLIATQSLNVYTGSLVHSLFTAQIDKLARLDWSNSVGLSWRWSRRYAPALVQPGRFSGSSYKIVQAKFLSYSLGFFGSITLQMFWHFSGHLAAKYHVSDTFDAMFGKVALAASESVVIEL